MTNNRKPGWLGLISSVGVMALIFTACSANIPNNTAATPPASAASQTSQGAPVINDINDIFGSADASLTDEETSANGVTLGFTENGNPYRGSLDAPIVLEEFSDFQ